MSGYIWYVDIEYPSPKIGFYTSWNDTLYLDTSCGTNNVKIDPNGRYRFGKEIVQPDTRTNKVEY